MRIRKPEVKRYQRPLDQISTDNESESDKHKFVGVFPAERLPDLRHVQSPDASIEQCDAGENKVRSDGVCDGKVQGALQAAGIFRLVSTKRKRGGAHQLKKDEQVEHIAGQRESAHGREKSEDQCVQVVFRRVEVLGGKRERGQSEDACKAGHAGAEGIDDKGDAKRHSGVRAPTSKPIHDAF